MSRPRPPSRPIWRIGVPMVTLLAGVLLSTTHGLAGGADIRRSDAPRLVDLVRDAQGSADRLSERRDALATEVDSFHGRSTDAALSAMQSRIAELGEQAGQTAMRGPGLVVTMTDAQRDADGRFPRDAAPDDLVVHQQDISAVLNALWSAGAEAVQMQDQRIIATSAPRCVGSTLLLNGRTYSPPYTISAIGDPTAMQAALAEAPLVILYRQYVVRFGLGYSEEEREQLEVVAHSEPIRVQYAKPTGPIPY